MPNLLRIGLMLIAGFLTWGLAFGRSAAWDARHRGYLMMIVFVDELMGVGCGVYLARSGTWPEVVAAAVGGTVAAAIVLKIKGCK